MIAHGHVTRTDILTIYRTQEDTVRVARIKDSSINRGFEVQSYQTANEKSFFTALDTVTGDFFLFSSWSSSTDNIDTLTVYKLVVTSKSPSTSFDWHNRISHVMTDEDDDLMAYSTTGNGFAIFSTADTINNCLTLSTSLYESSNIGYNSVNYYLANVAENGMGWAVLSSKEMTS